jgi:hypothetical protein
MTEKFASIDEGMLDGVAGGGACCAPKCDWDCSPCESIKRSVFQTVYESLAGCLKSSCAPKQQHC